MENGLIMAIKYTSLSSASPSAFAVTIATANVPQTVVKDISTGVYTISVSPTSSTATVQFVSGSTWIGQTITSSGSITYNLATAADKVYIQSSVASDVVTINLVASAPANSAISGTLDTITTSGTYTQTGLLWVLAIGGGSSGNNEGYGYAYGGGAGATAMFYGNVTSSTSVTIGAAGVGRTGDIGNPGGTTSFGSYAIAGGGGGANGYQGGIATAGNVLITGATGATSYGFRGATTLNYFRGIKDGTYGGGGAGYNNGTGNSGYVGGGSGIGTGGSGGFNGANGGAATGYGSGGGGAISPGTGGNGSPGVVYVLRGF